MTKPTILFLCTGNCCRSQIAEGIMRKLAGDRLDNYSAGSSPAGYVHPLAIAVMHEQGVDISEQYSKGLEDLPRRTFDYVVSVCDHARAACPTLKGRKATYHWPMEDPVMLVRNEHEAMEKARRVRNDLEVKLAALLEEITGEARQNA